MSNIVAANNDAVETPTLENTSFDKMALQAWTKDLDTDRSKMLKNAMTGLILIFGFGGIWACTAPLGGAVIAAGSIVAEGRNRPIQHLEGGILKQVHVQEGDTVAKGDILLELDTTRLDAILKVQRLKKAIARLELARYQAEAGGETTVSFPTDIDPAVVSTPGIVQALKSQRAAFETSLKDRQASGENIDTKILGLRSDIEGHGKVLVALDRQLELFRLELADFKELMAKGLMKRTRVFATERSVVELVATIQSRHLAIGKAENGILIYETERKQRRFRFLAESNLRLVATQKAYNDAAGAVTQLLDSVGRSVVRSPIAGTVFQLALRTAGEVIKPGVAIMILFPEDDTLTIEAYLQAVDRDEVFVGQDVKVVFPSDKENQGLPIAAKLIYISADTIKSEGNPAGTYLVKVTMPPETSPEQAVPGNIVEVYIQTEAQTFIEIIAEPFTRFAFKAFKG